jgi:hypothetical protein
VSEVRTLTYNWVSKVVKKMQNPNLVLYDSSELGEELCPVSSSLPLRVHA